MKKYDKLEIGKRYWLDDSKTVSAELKSFDDEGYPDFHKVDGQHGYILNDDGTVGFADFDFYLV